MKSLLVRRGGYVTVLAASAALLAAAVAIAAAPATTPAAAPAVDQKGPTILSTYKDRFLIGTAGDPPGGFTEDEINLIKENFNALTPENYLKPAPVHPLENTWSFKRPDALVKWCADNNIVVHGHTLLWHSQTNNWFFEGRDRDTVIKRMENHIKTLVGRYKGKIKSWDVVNEAIEGNAPNSENLRASSQWLQIVGPQFLNLAFKFAHEADPDAKLYYNDYNIESGVKHESSMIMLRRLIAEKVPIHGVGIQGHWSTNGLPYAALDRAIANYASLGLKVSITELDITIAGAAGGQLAPGVGGPADGPPRGGPRGGAPGTPAPGGAPGGPGGAFLFDDDALFFTAAPAGPAAPGAPGAAGARGGGRGGRGGRGAIQPPVNPASTIEAAVTDLSQDQKTRLAAATTEIGTKLTAWQGTAQGELLAVQPQYTPGQVAYNFEIQEYNAELARQNGLRDEIINEGEAQLAGILTRTQAEKWQTAQLTAQFTTQFGALNVTEAQRTRVNTVIAESAKALSAARDKGAVAAAKAEFTKGVLASLTGEQVAQYNASLQPAAGRGGPGAGRGRGGGGAPSAAGLKAQADAYARVFAIFEKHKAVLERVTFWGLNDARSWRTGQNPLVFDANNQRKPAYVAIVDAILKPDPNLAAPR